MPVGVAIAVFVVCLAVMLGASEILVRGIDRIGAALRLSGGLIGLVAALGADSPEISSALVALFSGARDVGIGVIFGSNIFNLAALLGLSAFVATRVDVTHDALKLHGGVALTVTLIVAAFVVRILTPIPMVALLLIVFVPYVVVLALRPRQLTRLPRPLAALLDPFVECTEKAGAQEKDSAGLTATREQRGVGGAGLRIALALVVIVAASIGLVRATLVLAGHWGLPRGLVGVLILAALTGLPNTYAAVRLATQGRGAEVVSEAFNSNTINLLVGIGLPALIVGMGGGGRVEVIELLWLLGMTVLALPLLARRGGLTRIEGAVLISLYLVFVAVRIIVS